MEQKAWSAGAAETGSHQAGTGTTQRRAQRRQLVIARARRVARQRQQTRILARRSG